MSTVHNDLESFHQFASLQLTGKGTKRTLEDLLRDWRAQEERNATIESVQRGIEDSANGRVRGLTEVDADIRKELGLFTRGK